MLATAGLSSAIAIFGFIIAVYNFPSFTTSRKIWMSSLILAGIQTSFFPKGVCGDEANIYIDAYGFHFGHIFSHLAALPYCYALISTLRDAEKDQRMKAA